ncbi:guanylate cyclase [Legionella sainthelensi]|uniref:GAF domain-containing protein n=1 Tax=Legionella sainthelensi TaxID=28087 RepID=UPI000F6BE299|nr:GAF domain-containing protein [Legionella sainthelensi]VEB34943.1 guanylate cyclase [Legionella sainthelensi]
MTQKTGELYSFIAQGDLNFEIRILNNSGLAGWSFTHNESLCIAHPELDERHNKNIDKITGFKTKSVLCVPLKSMEGKLLGVTQMLNKIDAEFSDSDVQMVEALTEHAAMAIQNKLTIEQIEESHKRDMHLLETISTVLQKLIFLRF